jgi:hypothetical protein
MCLFADAFSNSVDCHQTTTQLQLVVAVVVISLKYRTS